MLLPWTIEASPACWNDESAVYWSSKDKGPGYCDLSRHYSVQVLQELWRCVETGDYRGMEEWSKFQQGKNVVEYLRERVITCGCAGQVFVNVTSTTYNRIIPYYLPNYKTTAKTIFKCRSRTTCKFTGWLHRVLLDLFHKGNLLPI